MRPMKAPKLENACLDRARRTRKRKSSRQKTLLIIRQYDTRLQPQHFLSMRQRVWWQQRVAQNKKQRKHPQPQTKEELQQWLIDFVLREFNEDPIDQWNTSSVTNMMLMVRSVERRRSINRSVSGKLNWQLCSGK